MAVEIDLAPRHGPFAGTLDPAAIDQYAAATNDTNAPVATGTAVPATFPVILIFDAQWAANAAVPQVGVRERTQRRARRARGPVAPTARAGRDAGDVLRAVRGAQHARRRTRRAAHGAVRHRRRARGRALVDHLLPRLRRARRRGPGATRPHLPGRGPRPPGRLGRRSTSTSTTATRYAEVSNDWSAHHFDLETARKAGVDYLFAHGLCTMAMCTQAAVGHGRRR